MGTDFIQNNPLGLMKGRLGLYDTQPTTHMTLSGRDHQKVLLDQLGGADQQERMILEKRRDLAKAVYLSHQSAEILKYGDEQAVPVRALINPNKLKQDYDDKLVSVDYIHGFATGDIFEWVGTGTYWLIYLQDLTERAYLRGNIRRCSYKIAWENECGQLHETYAAVRGPVETTINNVTSSKISIDNPNLSVSLLLPLNDDTLQYFRRYNKFYLQKANGGVESLKVCWKIQAIDWISTPGILEVVAMEDYSNSQEDDLESGIVGGLVVSPMDPPINEECLIEGENLIDAKFEYVYTYTGDAFGEWSYDSTKPLKTSIFSDELGRPCISITWTKAREGTFELRYAGENKIITVQSLF